MRAARKAIDGAKQRIADLSDDVAQRRAAAHRSLSRGVWSSRLSACAFVGSALLTLLPVLDPQATTTEPPQPAASRDAPATRAALLPPAAATRAPAGAKLPGSLGAALIDDAPSTRPLPEAPTWQIVPTRRMDLTGHVVDSADPIAVARGDGDTASKTTTRAAGRTKTAAAGNASPAAPEPKPEPAGKSSTDKPLPVPPASAPSEQQADAWTDAEVAEARAECARLVTGLTLEGEEAAPVRNGACGTPAPITLKRAGGAMTELSPPALVNCRFAVKLNDWINDTLQPAAQASFGQPVVRIVTASSYVCRNRYGQAKAPISEHAFANALDMSAFVLRDGRVVKVVDSWGPTARDTKAAEEKAAATKEAGSKQTTSAKSDGDKPTKVSLVTDAKSSSKSSRKSKGDAAAAPDASETPRTDKSASAEATFLHKIHGGACGPFGTVLGPEANEAHRDHIHVDLKLRKHAHICE